MSIDPEKAYPLREACALIPSPYGGGDGIAPDTFHRWRRSGLAQAWCRKLGQRRHWFVLGSEVLRLRGEETVREDVRS
jgi:hypothetical protein